MNGRQLADTLGASQAHVSRLRSGDRLPSMAMMWAIESALGWPATEQLAAVRDKSYHTELTKRLDADTTTDQEVKA